MPCIGVAVESRCPIPLHLPPHSRVSASALPGRSRIDADSPQLMARLDGRQSRLPSNGIGPVAARSVASSINLPRAAAFMRCLFFDDQSDLLTRCEHFLAYREAAGGGQLLFVISVVLISLARHLPVVLPSFAFRDQTLSAAVFTPSARNEADFVRGGRHRSARSVANLRPFQRASSARAVGRIRNTE